MLSTPATQILEVLAAINFDSRTRNYLQTCKKGYKWLPVDNILNGHGPEVPEDYLNLLDSLSSLIQGTLIDSKGQNSKYYYELKKAGVHIWVIEQDSCGPLICAIVCPDSDWRVSYG